MKPNSYKNNKTNRESEEESPLPWIVTRRRNDAEETNSASFSALQLKRLKNHEEPRKQDWCNETSMLEETSIKDQFPTAQQNSEILLHILSSFSGPYQKLKNPA